MSLEVEVEKESPPPSLWELCISGDVEGVEEVVRRGDQVHLDLLLHTLNIQKLLKSSNTKINSFHIILLCWQVNVGRDSSDDSTKTCLMAAVQVSFKMAKEKSKYTWKT